MNTDQNDTVSADDAGREPSATTVSAYRDAAIRNYRDNSDGGIDIDDNAIVSASEDGAYVAAWVWVPREVIEACEHCVILSGEHAESCPTRADDLDRESSASRQHFIDTGVYLKRGDAL